MFVESLYGAGIVGYQTLVRVAALFHKKAKLLCDGQRKTWQIIEQQRTPGSTYYWFHAASLGEFEQGRPVIEAIKRIRPEQKILLTFFSPSGYEIRKNYAGADIITYLPFDTLSNAKRLLKVLDISKAVFIKYEFWPNYLKALQLANIPTFSISAIFRKNHIVFKPYGHWYRRMLPLFTHIFVQDNNSLARLRAAGFDHVTQAGDTRFDRVLEIASNQKAFPLIDLFTEKAVFVLIAGSTWPADEDLILRWMLENQHCKVVIAPHEIGEANVQRLLKKAGGKAIRYTCADIASIGHFQCLILDTVGMLSSVYKVGHIAYVGGGFGAGIHNIIEAAVWNIPVVFGPKYAKFQEAHELIGLGAALSVTQYAELVSAIQHLTQNATTGIAAGQYVRQHAGATPVIAKRLMQP